MLIAIWCGDPWPGGGSAMLGPPAVRPPSTPAIPGGIGKRGGLRSTTMRLVGVPARPRVEVGQEDDRLAGLVRRHLRLRAHEAERGASGLLHHAQPPELLLR